MQPVSPVIVLMPANDLPSSPASVHARERQRERRLRAPSWAEPRPPSDVA